MTNIETPLPRLARHLKHLMADQKQHTSANNGPTYALLVYSSGSEHCCTPMVCHSHRCRQLTLNAAHFACFNSMPAGHGQRHRCKEAGRQTIFGFFSTSTRLLSLMANKHAPGSGPYPQHPIATNLGSLQPNLSAQQTFWLDCNLMGCIDLHFPPCREPHTLHYNQNHWVPDAHTLRHSAMPAASLHVRQSHQQDKQPLCNSTIHVC